MDVQRICRNTVFTSVVSALCSGFTVFLLILGVTFICRSTRSVEYKANKDEPFRTVPKPREAPCERKYCAYGATCVAKGKRAKCRCKKNCDDKLFAPVCGTDGVTYTSECKLKMESCQRQVRIKVRSQGECGSSACTGENCTTGADVKDPCKEKDCSYGAQCVPSLDGLTARCQCPQKCNRYGDSVGSTPVCGSNGKDYENQCEMRRAACNEMMDTRVKYFGRCDPCDGYECPTAHVCQLDENRKPMCRCNGLCTLEFAPVCGSDGRTYSNECIMRVESCKARKQIRVLFRGECSSGNNPCNSLSCGPGEECRVDRNGNAKCECPPPCEQVLRPVCGSDHVTYDNDCELRRQSCLNKRPVTIAFVGECSIDGPCSHHRCNYGDICVVKHNQPVCQCPTCSEEFQPVCGSDGISYSNECKLRAEACERKKNIAVRYQGLCNGCEHLSCDHYGICESDGKGGAQCVCPSSCIQVEDKVCGTDGVTYQNECELRVASCRKSQFVMIASQGPCDLCVSVKCRFGARCESGKCVCPQHCPDRNEPVCANDGQTYSSECDMRKQACSGSSELEVVHSGECDGVGSGEDGSGVEVCDESSCQFGGTCEYDAEGSHGCVCNFNCDAVRSPVCGSNGKTYGNECELREAACEIQMHIMQVDMSNCDDLVEELCDGKPALINPSTGRDYDCRTGRERCPGGSYCHKVAEGAKCCREEDPIRNCGETRYGCCPDGRTAAPGPNDAGCPSVCQCHPLGAYSATCDPSTLQCTCKPGVGGRRCDRCEPGFWGLPRIAEGNTGCTPCHCNVFGSVRDDCEQMTGRCVCKPGVTGSKCNICPNGRELGPQGCTESVGTTASPPSRGRKTTRHITGKVTRHIVPPTPASPEYGYVGDFCLSDEDCIVAHSYCKKGLCQCSDGYTTADDNLSCQDGDSADAESPGSGLDAACAGAPCGPDAECTPTPDGDFECLCPEGKTGRTCDQVQDLMMPSFAGRSYLELVRLHHVNKELRIELEFRTLNRDGLLLYAGQSANGQGDFVALTVRDGHVEFRYDLGSGPVVIRSPDEVRLNTFHTVVARRFGKDGEIRLDSGRTEKGASPGTLKSLNLETSLYMGYVPDATQEVFTNSGVDVGLVGCVMSLRVDSKEAEKEFNLMFPGSEDVIGGTGIGECGRNPCASLPCQNGGTCLKIDNRKFECKCNPGWTGETCGLDVSGRPCDPNPCLGGGTCSVLQSGRFSCRCPPGRQGHRCHLEGVLDLTGATVPEFHGNSYMVLEMKENIGHSFAFEVWFLAKEMNGVILYGTQNEGNTGDFLSLSLVNGYLQFRFDLGSGVANITSPGPISLNVWHRVDVARNNRHGTMVIDAEITVRGHSKGDLNELNLGENIYIGGYPGVYHPESGAYVGLHGAVQRVYENGQLVENFLTQAVSLHGVTEYNGAPCPRFGHACQNSAQCIAVLNDYECKCMTGYAGRHCERIDTNTDLSQPIQFDGRTYHKYPNKIAFREKAQVNNKLEVRLRTKAENGLLLLIHKPSTLQGDYLAIALSSGRVEVSYNLGKQALDDLHVITSDDTVNDDAWHTVVFTREKRKGTLTIDDGYPITDVSEQGATQLDTDGYLWLGGARHLPAGLPEAYDHGFVGCVSAVKIDDESLHLVEHRSSHQAVEFCQQP